MATRSLNKVFLLGNLTRDPELKYTQQETAVCTFVVATNREWSPSDTNEKLEDTEFHNVVAWSKLAELCAQLLYKGRKVFIEGRLNTVRWDDKETGKRMFRTEVVCNEMVALGPSRHAVEQRADGNALDQEIMVNLEQEDENTSESLDIDKG